MTDSLSRVAALARDLVAIDSRSFISNLALAERIDAELGSFDVERLDYVDGKGVGKRALVAHRGPPGGLALSGHMDTVPDTGWSEDPWSGRIENGLLHGLGSTDMKGAVAAAIVAAQDLPPEIPITLLITTDEETTKLGAKRIVERSALARQAAPRFIVVAEPTGMRPIRGHRAHVQFTATATGLQAHSSTGLGLNANWPLVPFLVSAEAIYRRLRSDTSLQDPAYDPPFSDFNIVIDNHGAAINVTVPRATATIKFRYSAKVDPQPIVDAVAEAADRAGLTLDLAYEGRPPELPETHEVVRLCESVTGNRTGVAPYGTDASQLQDLAPCIICGPGDIGVAHKPGETVALANLEEAVVTFGELARRAAT
jgi:acetylornithine deacetylase